MNETAIVYIVHSDLDENNIFAMFEEELEAIMYARKHKEDLTYVDRTEMTLDESGDYDEVLSAETIWVYDEEDEVPVEEDDDYWNQFTIEDDTTWFEDLDTDSLVETLEENEDIVECKECFELFPKEACTKIAIGYICPECGKIHSHEEPEFEIDSIPDVVIADEDTFKIDFPEVERVDYGNDMIPDEPTPEPMPEVGPNPDPCVGPECEAPVEAPVTKDETITKLVIDEHEAIDGYEKAKIEIEANSELDEKEKEEILDTIEHIKEEEIEHIEELEELVDEVEEIKADEESESEDESEVLVEASVAIPDFRRRPKRKNVQAFSNKPQSSYVFNYTAADFEALSNHLNLVYKQATTTPKISAATLSYPFKLYFKWSNDDAIAHAIEMFTSNLQDCNTLEDIEIKLDPFFDYLSTESEYKDDLDFYDEVVSNFADALWELKTGTPVDKEGLNESLKSWDCWFDDEYLGTVNADNEQSAYTKMCDTWPEHHYGLYDGVAWVTEVEDDSDTLLEVFWKASLDDYFKKDGKRNPENKNGTGYWVDLIDPDTKKSIIKPEDKKTVQKLKEAEKIAALLSKAEDGWAVIRVEGAQGWNGILEVYEKGKCTQDVKQKKLDTLNKAWDSQKVAQKSRKKLDKRLGKGDKDSENIDLPGENDQNSGEDQTNTNGNNGQENQDQNNTDVNNNQEDQEQDTTNTNNDQENQDQNNNDQEVVDTNATPRKPKNAAAVQATKEYKKIIAVLKKLGITGAELENFIKGKKPTKALKELRTMLFKESLEEHVNEEHPAIESDQELEGIDNAVVDCKVNKVITHSEDEKPVDCEGKKKPLEKPLTESSLVKGNYEISPTEHLSWGWDKGDSFYVEKNYRPSENEQIWNTEFRRTYATAEDAEKAFKRYVKKYSVLTEDALDWELEKVEIKEDSLEETDTDVKGECTVHGNLETFDNTKERTEDDARFDYDKKEDEAEVKGLSSDFTDSDVDKIERIVARDIRLNLKKNTK